MFSKKSVFLLAFTVLTLMAGVSSLRADGLPGEYIITPRWRDLLTYHSPSANPSFLTEENYVSLHGALSTTLGNFSLWEIGATVPIGLYRSVGLTWIGEAADQVTPTRWDGNSLVEDGEATSNQNSYFIASYATNPWNRLSLGANLAFAYQSNFDNKPLLGMGIDLGMSYRLIRHPVIGDHLVGASMQNLVGPYMDSTDFFPNLVKSLNPGSGGPKYSVNARFSWLAYIWEKRIELGLEANVKDFFAQTEDFAATPTSEGSTSIEFDLNGRIGFWILRVINAYFQFEPAEYWGLSGGVNVPTINNGRDFQVLYQFMSITEEQNEANSHTVYLRADVGKHREEIYARKMARLANILPNDLYNKARSLFNQEKYWDAYYIFGRILAEYPDFFKNDWVNYYIGRCQEEMDMRQASIESFTQTKDEYPKSVVVPYSDLGMMRVYYRDNNGSSVANQFSRLNSPNVPDSIKYHAFYIMGEQHVREGNYQKAVQLFDLIPEMHPEYVFAQHSKAVAHALADNMSLAINALENCVQAMVQTKAQEEIVNRSYVFLGYIFFEGLGGQERALSKAVTALRKVPKNSYYYNDALLGLAWTALKAQQWVDCVDASRELQNRTDNIVLQSEGALLEGYCAMVRKNYDEAVSILDPAAQKVNSASGPSESELATAKDKYQMNRQDYQNIARRSKELALTRQTSAVVSSIDSLRGLQTNVKDMIDEYQVFSDDFSRRSFFARNIPQVREDIEYALATAQKLAGTSDVQKVQKKTVEETEEIDEEMQRLKEQLEQLDE
jgi:tetratricopeptide (TPR) repeat protein